MTMMPSTARRRHRPDDQGRLAARPRPIIVDEWGPYDWKSPKLWPAGRSDETPLTLRVLGPPGRVDGDERARRDGVADSRASCCARSIVTPATTRRSISRVTLDYRGGEVDLSPRRAQRRRDSPTRSATRRFFAPIDWTINFFEYGDGTDPVKQPAAFAKLTAGAPLKTLSANRLDYISGRALEDGVPRDRVALVAQGKTTLPPGTYMLQVISDDGVRVWMDDAVIIDEWTPHESQGEPRRDRRRRRAPLQGRVLRRHWFC